MRFVPHTSCLRQTLLQHTLTHFGGRAVSNMSISCVIGNRFNGIHRRDIRRRNHPVLFRNPVRQKRRREHVVAQVHIFSTPEGRQAEKDAGGVRY